MSVNKNLHNLLEENIYKQFSISLSQNKKEEVEQPEFHEWFEEQTAIGGIKFAIRWVEPILYHS